MTLLAPDGLFYACDYVDLFAGPGGWDAAARALGLDGVGIELDPSACETRRAAGLRTVQGSVLDHRPRAFRDNYPWQGTKTKQYEQVGNAIPPQLAWHILGAVAL